MPPTKEKNIKAQVKAARREQQQKKAAAKEKKRLQKTEQHHEETPIDVLLQQLDEEQQQRQINIVHLVACTQPSPRAHASLTLLPSGDLLIFGGESYDGKKVRVYGDLYKWNMDKNEWRRIEGPVVPKARCAHQAVYHNDAVYIFGGEFSTFYQFHHYKDFWRFDLKTNLWKKILVDSPVHVPSARSGHRMVVWRGLLILFGGFHDSGRDTRYFNDLYLFSFSENIWKKVEYPVHAHIPEPRSGFVFVVVGDLVFLHGGFAKIRDTNKRVQGKTFADSWLLDLKPLAKGALTNSPIWEKIKNSGSSPSPRTGMCATGHKSSVILFGGVADQDDGGTTLESKFFNEMYLFDVSKRRWYPLTLKNKRPEKRRAITPVVSSGERESDDHDVCDEGVSSGDDEENWQNTFAYFDAKGKLVKIHLENLKCGDPDSALFSASQEQDTDREGGASCRERNDKLADTQREAEFVPDTTPEETAEPAGRVTIASSAAEWNKSYFSAEIPLPRLNGTVVVRGSSLVLFGGIMELGNKEITLDDCWSLNIHKRDRWERVLEGTMHENEWQGVESPNDDSSESGDSDTDSGSQISESDDSQSECEYKLPVPSNLQGNRGGRCRVRDDIEQFRESYGLDNPQETPTAGESLKDFFARTKSYWIDQVSANADPQNADTRKDLARSAFAAASARFASIESALLKIDALSRKEKT